MDIIGTKKSTLFIKLGFQSIFGAITGGTNIMLTVGFGDISATNTTEAIFLIFIETLSCITLAYNISCLGSIIS